LGLLRCYLSSDSGVPGAKVEMDAWLTRPKSGVPLVVLSR